MLVESWYAELALRRRVSMSAIGSVMVMAVRLLSRIGFQPDRFVRERGAGPGASDDWGEPGKHLCPGFGVSRHRREAVGHQDDLVTPGSSPAWAISRRQMRHSPNLR